MHEPPACASQPHVEALLLVIAKSTGFSATYEAR
jgi:hypothetical protein